LLTDHANYSESTLVAACGTEHSDLIVQSASSDVLRDPEIDPHAGIVLSYCDTENSTVGGCSSSTDDGSSHFSNGSSVSSGSDVDDVNAEKPSIAVQLCEWAVQNNITHSALGSLLKILKPYHTSLPIDPRTLLKTPQNYTIKQILGVNGQMGQYYHFGIVAGINHLMSLGYQSRDNIVFAI
jgi:hypothetical protein